MGQGSQNYNAEEIDEHDQPTEPMPRLVMPSGAPDSTIGSSHPDASIPMPQPYEQPFPRQHIQNIIPTWAPRPGPHDPKADVYPYLPPAPGGSPFPGQPSATPVYPTPANKPADNKSASTQRSPSAIPIWVGIGFVALQLLLLVRFSIRLINLSTSLPWVSAVYALSDVFVQPFRTFLYQFTVAIPMNIELYTLCAILAYGVFSRVLVHNLKIFLRTR